MYSCVPWSLHRREGVPRAGGFGLGKLRARGLQAVIVSGIMAVVRLAVGQDQRGTTELIAGPLQNQTEAARRRE